MTIKDVLKDAEDRMKSTVSVLEEDLRGMRTGRASTGLVEKLAVDTALLSTNLVPLRSAIGMIPPFHGDGRS